MSGIEPVVAKASLLVEAGRYAAARSLLAPLAVQRGDDARVVALLARCLIEEDRAADALTLADQALARDPAAGYAWQLRCQALLQLDRVPEALAAAREAVAARPTAWSAHFDLGNALLRSGRRHRAEARAEAEEAARLAPHEVAPQLLLGAVAEAGGRLREARQAYSEALARDPQHADARLRLSRVESLRGRTAAAARGYAAVLAAEPARDAARAGLYEAVRAPFLRAVLPGWAALGIALLGIRAQDPPGRQPPATGALWGWWALLPVLLLWLGWARYAHRALPPELRPRLLRLVPRDLPLALCALSAAAAVPGPFLALALPWPRADVPRLLVDAGALLQLLLLQAGSRLLRRRLRSTTIQT